MALGLNIVEEERGKLLLLHLEGRLDASTAPTLEKKLSEHIDANHLHILLNFSKVNYLSSAGMRLLLATTKKLKSQEGTLAFCSMSDDVMEIIKMAGFERVLTIYPDETQALEHLGRE